MTNRSFEQRQQHDNRLGKPYVLVVDDDEDQLELFKMFFECQNNCQVVTASSASEAVETLKQIHVDLVVCDVNMPGISGTELVSRLRKARDQAYLPIVSVTADLAHDRNELLACGADEFCYKSGLLSLRQSVEKLLAAQTHSSSLMEQVRARFDVA